MPSCREGSSWGAPGVTPIPSQSPRTSPTSVLFRQLQHLPKLGDQAAQVGALPEDLAALAAAVEAGQVLLAQHSGRDGLDSQADASGQQGGFFPRAGRFWALPGWAAGRLTKAEAATLGLQGGSGARISQTGLCKTKSSS